MRAETARPVQFVSPGAAGSPRGPAEGKPVIPLREARPDLRAAPEGVRLPSDPQETTRECLSLSSSFMWEGPGRPSGAVGKGEGVGDPK